MNFIRKIVENKKKKNESRVCCEETVKRFVKESNVFGHVMVISDRYSICSLNLFLALINPALYCLCSFLFLIFLFGLLQFVWRLTENTYVNFFPLVDVADETRQSEKPDKRQQFGQAQDPQRSTGLQDLKAFAKVLHT